LYIHEEKNIKLLLCLPLIPPREHHNIFLVSHKLRMLRENKATLIEKEQAVGIGRMTVQVEKSKSMM